MKLSGNAALICSFLDTFYVASAVQDYLKQFLLKGFTVSSAPCPPLLHSLSSQGSVHLHLHFLFSCSLGSLKSEYLGVSLLLTVIGLFFSFKG